MPLLELAGISVTYGAVRAVRDVSLNIAEGEVVTLIGANGAGKSTILRTVSRLVRESAGTMSFDGKDLQRLSPDRVVRLGIAHCPEGRQVLARQTVRDNLELGGYTRRDRQGVRDDIRRMFQLFPRLEERSSQSAGTLSGGEQQMLAIARALMSRPRLLLLDEPSLGLAPLIVREIFSIIRGLNSEGVTIFLVEQNARLALQHSHRAYVLEAGRIVIDGPAQQLLDDERVLHAYLGG